ncbi:tripartite tricarboxylate transporter substrate binding protein [Sporomusa sp.]|uniref:tripartite tricarboxylate transporter substrate binding protein n=1 Tax=Sporomusa sp. TaxID=2078658 RepID=UPI002D05F01D|nr:tripartite tricarboxylate transporter substrate binding protein [Sporomusa sp.]HWR08126.1 tripartite tricarboxylate transporter substrate binding protein [Sporomusa sp.]
MQNPSIPINATTKFPEKSITMVVPFSVGSGSDLIARSLEKMAPKHLGQPLVIINKPGGAGTIGWNELAGATPDGYTLAITGVDMLLLPLYGSAKYDYLTALQPLAQITAVPLVLVVQSSQPWQTLNDLIEYAKNHPGKLKFANSGIGGFTHVLGESFAQVAGIAIEQVPFSGGGESTSALLGGHVELCFVNPMLIKEHIKNGTVRALAVTGDQRVDDPIFAQVPTFKEQRLDISLNNWFGIAIPKEVPVEIRNKLAEGFKAIISDPEFKNNMNNVGLKAQYLGPQESQDKWLADSQKLSKTLQDSGVLEKIKAQRK